MKTTTNPRNAGRKQKGYYQNGYRSDVVKGSFSYNGLYAVYGLASLANPEKIQYIGITSSKLNARYNNHISQSKNAKTNKEKWIRSLLENNDHLLMIILKDAIPSLDEACEWETHFIKTHRSLDTNLTNQTNGGIGLLGYIHTDETRRKQSVATSGENHYKKKKPNPPNIFS